MRYFQIIILIVASLWATTGCSNSSDVRDKYVGEWKSANPVFKTNMFIKRSGDNYIITSGNPPQDMIGTYEEATKKLIVDGGIAKVPILYMADTDEILVTSAMGGTNKLSRVK